VGCPLSKDLPDLHFEIYEIHGDQLRYVKDYYVKVPWRFAPAGYSFGEFDYQTNSLIVYALRDWPYPSDRYVYNFNENSLKKLSMWGDVFFIDPEILKNSAQYVDLNKLK
jgi:hypothetical protein